MPIDAFFDLFAHHDHTEIAVAYDVTPGSVRSFLSSRVTEKALRDKTSRKAVKDELNVRREANKVTAPLYGVRTEDCGQDKSPKRANADRDTANTPSSKTSNRVAQVSSSQAKGKGAATVETPAPVPRGLANYQGHEIYEENDEIEYSDQNGTDDELEEGEIREDPLDRPPTSARHYGPDLYTPVNTSASRWAILK